MEVMEDGPCSSAAFPTSSSTLIARRSIDPYWISADRPSWRKKVARSRFMFFKKGFTWQRPHSSESSLGGSYVLDHPVWQNSEYASRFKSLRSSEEMLESSSSIWE
jgi:hypothetical protein